MQQQESQRHFKKTEMLAVTSYKQTQQIIHIVLCFSHNPSREVYKIELSTYLPLWLVTMKNVIITLLVMRTLGKDHIDVPKVQLYTHLPGSKSQWTEMNRNEPPPK